MSVVVGVSVGLVGTGAVGLVLVPGVTGAVCANAALERPSAAIPRMRVRIVFSFPDHSGSELKRADPENDALFIFGIQPLAERYPHWAR
jgi:hypothetical protein